MYLKNALDLEDDYPSDSTNLAGTHLNLCAVYSQLGDHDKALENAIQALDILSSCREKKTNLLETLMIAYHNVGTENEHLNQRKNAIHFYKKGYDLSSKFLGLDHDLTEMLRISFENLKLSLVRFRERGYSPANYSALKKIGKFEPNFRSEMETLSTVSGSHVIDTRTSHELERVLLKHKHSRYTKPKNITNRHKINCTAHSVSPSKLTKSEGLLYTSVPTNKSNTDIFRRKRKEPLNVLNNSYERKIINITTSPSKPINKTMEPRYINKTPAPSKTLIKTPIPPKTKNNNLYGNRPIKTSVSVTPTILKEKKEEYNSKPTKDVNILEPEKDINNLVVGIQKNWKRYQAMKNFHISKYMDDQGLKNKTHIREAIGIKFLKTQPIDERYINSTKKVEFDFAPVPQKVKMDSPLKEKRKLISMNKYEKKLPKIIFLQSNIKGYLARTRYLRTLKSIVKIQSTYRMHMVKSLYKAIKSAIIYIQSYYRGYLIRKRCVVN